MIKKYIEYSPIIFGIVFIASFVLGLTNSIPIEIKQPIINKKIEIDIYTILYIASRNILLALALLIGFFTANILNYALVFYNGITIGITVSMYSKIVNSKQLAISILPHSFIEFFWIILISSLSVKLFFSFIKLLNSQYENKEFIKILMSRKCLIYFSLVIIGILVEVIITPFLINLYF